MYIYTNYDNLFRMWSRTLQCQQGSHHASTQPFNEDQDGHPFNHEHLPIRDTHRLASLPKPPHQLPFPGAVPPVELPRIQDLVPIRVQVSPNHQKHGPVKDRKHPGGSHHCQNGRSQVVPVLHQDKRHKDNDHRYQRM